jgi:DNA-binding LacI/PurR family transcriptional regulator
MAYGVLKGLRALGKKVPDDISVVGMDDLDLSTVINPPLTTVRTDIAKMASLAAQFAIKQISTPLLHKGHLPEMPTPQLIARDSCEEKK